MRRWMWIAVVASMLMLLTGAVAETFYMTPEEVVAFLENDMIYHGKDYGMNASYDYVSAVFEKMGFKRSPKYRDSRTYWEALSRQGRTHPVGEAIPVGADVFFDNGSGWLMGIYIGNNTVIMNRMSGGSYGVEKITSRNYWYRDRYVGWAWHDNVNITSALPRITIDAKHFPDANFRQYVWEELDPNGDGYLTQAEAEEVEDIVCYERNISSLKGIEYFSALTYLECYDNQLSVLDVSQNKNLETLYCQRNNLKVLDLTKNTKLEYLNCQDNQLSELDLTNNPNLLFLYCGDNNIRRLNIEKCTKLYELECSDNLLTELDISNHSRLIQLLCEGNEISTLDIRSCPSLLNMYISGGKTIYDTFVRYDDNNPESVAYLSIELDVIVIATDIKIDSSHFPDANFRQYVRTELDADNDGYLSQAEVRAVEEIDCDDLNIASLKGIEYFSELKELYCRNNRLSELDVSNNQELKKLSCYNNQLTKLNIRENDKLWDLQCSHNRLSVLDFSYYSELQYLSCEYNRLKQLDTSEILHLRLLECQNNMLSSLDITNNKYLFRLLCENNSIKTIDISACPSLISLYTSGERFVYDDYVSYDGGYDTDAELRVGSNVNIARGNIKIDDIHFPDDHFREYVLLECDTDGDGALSTREIQQITVIECGNSDISALDGIEYFTELTYLDCYANNLKELDVSNNTALTELDCSFNQLQWLSLNLNPKLTILRCNDNDLERLNIWANYALTELYCSSNNLSQLYTAYLNELTSLGCEENNISVLDVSQCPNLIWLNCSECQLSELNTSGNPLLEKLLCSENYLDRLDVSANSELTLIACNENNLRELDVSNNPKLDRLYCDKNNIKTLDLSNCPSIIDLEEFVNAIEIYADDGTVAHIKVEENSWFGEYELEFLLYDLGVDLISEHRDFTVLNLPGSLETVMEAAFEGAAADVVVVPDGCQAIETRAFADCGNLTKIYIPDSVEVIADDAFGGSKKVRFVTDSRRLRDWAVDHGIVWIG